MPITSEKENPPPYTPSAPPIGFNVPQSAGYAPVHMNEPIHSTQGPTAVHVDLVQQPAQVVVLTGNCPKCHVGNLHKNYLTCCGILWAILLFPIGLLCLFCCSKNTCSHCSYSA